MKMIIEDDWELVHRDDADGGSFIDRLEIPCGWLYRHIMHHGAGAGSYETMSITFVPAHRNENRE